MAKTFVTLKDTNGLDNIINLNNVTYVHYHPAEVTVFFVNTTRVMLKPEQGTELRDLLANYEQ